MNLQETLTLLEKLLAGAMAIQCIEMLAIRLSWSDQGIWRWEILRCDPALRLFAPFFSEKGFARLQHSRLVLCAFILIFPSATFLNGLLLTLLFLTSYLTSIRWRGTFNGGSDSLALLNLLLLSLADLVQDPVFSRICLILMAVNLAATFVFAGLAKLLNRDWRRGRALPLLLATSNYRSGAKALGPLSHPSLAFFAGWLVMGFEILFPMAFLSRSLAIGFVCAALVFHFVNWRLFGLNRFLHVWGATYPVVFYFACSV